MSKEIKLADPLIHVIRADDQETPVHIRAIIIDNPISLKLRSQCTRVYAQMNVIADQLRDKYGDDYIDGMVQSFLTPDELDGLDTDKEKLQALADKMFDENGNLKPEYANTPEGRYIEMWQKKRALENLKQKGINNEPFKEQDIETLKQELPNNHVNSLVELAKTTQDTKVQNMVVDNLDDRRLDEASVDFDLSSL